MTTAVDLDWGAGGDTHRFQLRWGELVELEERCGASLFAVLARLQAGTPRLADIRETIRLGLIGGGMKPVEALRLVRLVVEGPHAETAAPAENALIAAAVLAVALHGLPESEEVDDAPKQKPAAADGSTSPASVEPQPPTA